MARGSSAPALKLIASAKLHTLHEGDDDNSVATATAAVSQNTMLIGAAVAGVALLAIVGIFLSKKKS